MIWTIPEMEWRDKIKPESDNAEVKPQYYTFTCLGARAKLSSVIALVSIIYILF